MGKAFDKTTAALPTFPSRLLLSRPLRARGEEPEAFRPSAPRRREPVCRWPATDDFTGCVVEIRALSLGAEQEVFSCGGSFCSASLDP